ncbi:MAG: integrase arm-type DNA-binding domain-containing protein [Rhodospirillales bacterium]|nr:integrase arm-type DNA-binding domain-containing protein [Rhodospirillales bacterium]
MADGRKPTGKHPEKRLSPTFVRKTSKPGRYYDGNGLFLKVDPSGAKRWGQRLVIHGRQRTLGLGGCALVSLAEAREAALENRKIARAGGDPLAQRRRTTAIPTFEAAAATVIDLHRHGWRNEKHAAQWGATLRGYAFPRLGQRSVADITTADVMAVLMPIWSEKPETARRVRQRISTVMKWAVAQGYRADNPAGDAIGAALSKHSGKTKRHHRALPHGEVAAAIETVRKSNAGRSVKLALEYLVLTAGRSGEVRLATWDEVDREAAIWTVPPSRMKAGREHRVPLSGRALEILDEAQALVDESNLIFPGTRPGKPLSDMTLSKLMRDLDLDGVPHGFRSSFRDWASELTNAPRDVMEAALAHTVRDKTEAAYNRSDQFERHRTLMNQWASYLDGAAGTVVPMAPRGA